VSHLTSDLREASQNSDGGFEKGERSSMVRINMVRTRKVRRIGRGGDKAGPKSRDGKAEVGAALKKSGRPLS
jgi:hypothetical protein